MKAIRSKTHKSDKHKPPSHKTPSNKPPLHKLPLLFISSKRFACLRSKKGSLFTHMQEFCHVNKKQYGRQCRQKASSPPYHVHLKVHWAAIMRNFPSISSREVLACAIGSKQPPVPCQAVGLHIQTMGSKQLPAPCLAVGLHTQTGPWRSPPPERRTEGGINKKS